MTTGLFVAALIAALPVFLAAVCLRWRAVDEEGLDDMVDTRFLFWDSPPQGAPESIRPLGVSTMAYWPVLAPPLMATAAR